MQTRLLAASTAAAAATTRKEVELQARARFTERTGALFRAIYVKRKKMGTTSRLATSSASGKASATEI